MTKIFIDGSSGTTDLLMEAVEVLKAVCAEENEEETA